MSTSLPEEILAPDVALTAPHARHDDHVPNKLVVVNLLAVIIPPLGLAGLAWAVWGWGFNAVHLAIFAGMYLITGFGITVGYHRLFTHRSFETYPWMKFLIGVAGSMAVEGPIRKWVATHRRHHQHSDDHEDPHSPHHHHHLGGLRGMFRGLVHAHVGWLMVPDAPGLSKYVPDLMKDRVVKFVSRTFPVWVLAGLLIPTVLGGLLTDLGTWSWTGALLGYLWGGLARIFFVHHVTWSINSICHVWGTRPFKSHDESRNNAFFGVFGMGEGWHNNHHAFPTSARHGLRWWELDASYVLIRAMALVGLAWDVKVPSADRLAAKRA